MITIASRRDVYVCPDRKHLKKPAKNQIRRRLKSVQSTVKKEDNEAGINDWVQKSHLLGERTDKLTDDTESELYIYCCFNKIFVSVT